MATPRFIQRPAGADVRSLPIPCLPGAASAPSLDAALFVERDDLAASLSFLRRVVVTGHPVAAGDPVRFAEHAFHVPLCHPGAHLFAQHRLAPFGAGDPIAAAVLSFPHHRYFAPILGRFLPAPAHDPFGFGRRQQVLRFAVGRSGFLAGDALVVGATQLRVGDAPVRALAVVDGGGLGRAEWCGEQQGQGGDVSKHEWSSMTMSLEGICFTCFPTVPRQGVTASHGRCKQSQLYAATDCSGHDFVTRKMTDRCYHCAVSLAEAFGHPSWTYPVVTQDLDLPIAY